MHRTTREGRGSVETYLGLGSNQGAGPALIREALSLLEEAGAAVEAISSLYRTEPSGTSGPWFWNAAARLRVAWQPAELLERCEEIESRLGRRSKGDGAPRPMDLDILVYGDVRMESPDLVLPHPRLAERRFVLAPLAEIAPELRVPGSAATVRELLAACSDRCRVEILAGAR